LGASQLATGGAPILDGRRQPSCGGTSRMTRECQVRICEGLGVKFPGPTRHKPRRQLGPGASLCPQYLQSRRNFVHRSERRQVPKAAVSRCSKRTCAQCGYSITSSARASSVGGTSRPSALAILRLMTSTNLTGAWTGSSLGLAPFIILST
jgi:hypothetical protein